MTDTCQRPGLVASLLLGDRQLQWSIGRCEMFLVMFRRGAESASLNYISCCCLIMSGFLLLWECSPPLDSISSFGILATDMVHHGCKNWLLKLASGFSGKTAQKAAEKLNSNYAKPVSRVTTGHCHSWTVLAAMSFTSMYFCTATGSEGLDNQSRRNGISCQNCRQLFLCACMEVWWRSPTVIITTVWHDHWGFSVKETCITTADCLNTSCRTLASFLCLTLAVLLPVAPLKACRPHLLGLIERDEK